MTTISVRVKVAVSVNGWQSNHFQAKKMLNFENQITAVQSFNQNENGPAISKVDK